jgi:hypothetical protein
VGEGPALFVSLRDDGRGDGRGNDLHRLMTDGRGNDLVDGVDDMGEGKVG